MSMKKLILSGVGVIALTTVIFTSCKKEQQQNPAGAANPVNTYGTAKNTGLIPENCGSTHNSILASYLASYPTLTASNYTTQVPIAENYINGQMNALFPASYYASIITKFGAAHISYTSNTTTDNSTILGGKYDGFVNSITSAGIFTSYGFSRLTEYRDIIFGGYTVSQMQTKFTTFDGKITHTLCNSAEYELLKSLKTVGASSTTYWTGANPTSPNKFIMGDCAGFLGGWVGAVMEEIHSNGSLSESNSSYRLGCGLNWGITGSAASGFW